MENNVESAKENIVIVNPKKETTALVKWLVANTDQDRLFKNGEYQRPKIASFAITANGRVFMATNGYTIATTLLDVAIPDLAQVPDGHYHPVKVTKDLIILCQYSPMSSEKPLPEMLLEYIDTEIKIRSGKPVESVHFNPSLLMNLAAGFEHVEFKFNGERVPILVTLQKNEALPSGAYCGVFMPMLINDTQKSVADIAAEIFLARRAPVQAEEVAEVKTEAELLAESLPL